MLWFFDRGNEHMRIETTHDASNGTFTLTVYRADGTQETEMFWDLPAFEQRIRPSSNSLPWNGGRPKVRDYCQSMVRNSPISRA